MAHNHNKIILNLMIKNESKIIERCLERALEHADAVSILDTGSTDNTVEICQKYLEKCGKPFKISVEPFKNFGYNRTISFQKAVELCMELEWDSDTTYAMAIDADMIIKPSPEFKNFKMTAAGYSLIQQNGVLKYYNNRFMKCGYNWKCVGVTHEYWSGDPVEKIPFEVFNIDDIGDGGCKSDKLERDINLFLEDLKIDPDNCRTFFYLAQSYKDLGNITEAIKYYKKRIKLGGWYEEVWYAHYQIAKCYESLKQPEKMEAWALKAFKYNPRRSEPLYFLVTYFKNNYEFFKAYHYYLKGKDIPFPKNDQLFIEYNIYEGLFDYENTILASYVINKTRQDALCDLVTYINNKTHHINNVFDNIIYYIEPLISDTYKGEYSRLFFPHMDEYQVSSCSIIPFNGKMLMNTRYINYYIDNRGIYHMRSADGRVRTKNAMTYLNSSYYPTDDVTMMSEHPDKTYPCDVEGLEDVRLFEHNNKIHFSATTKYLTDTGNIVVAVGEYQTDTKKMTNIVVLDPPQPSNCEKNWIYVPNSSLNTAKDKMNFIYNWHPLQIGSVNENNKLEIHTVFNTPTIFSRFRGSSNLCEYNGLLWGVTHTVQYSIPRKYYRYVVAFDKETMKPIMYSLPFVFRKHAIEYCLGFHIKDGKACFVFSQNDNEPGFITMPINNLRFLPIS
jgi:tetratricopeptide (TPR) repeat protein